MNDMTLSSGHRIRNSSPGGIIVSLKPECQSEGRNPRSAIFQAGSFSHCTRPHPQLFDIESEVQSLNDKI